jgi:hypothetical protein
MDADNEICTQKQEKGEGMTTNNVIIATETFKFQTCQKTKLHYSIASLSENFTLYNLYIVVSVSMLHVSFILDLLTRTIQWQRI